MYIAQPPVFRSSDNSAAMEAVVRRSELDMYFSAARIIYGIQGTIQDYQGYSRYVSPKEIKAIFLEKEAGLAEGVSQGARQGGVLIAHGIDTISALVAEGSRKKTFAEKYGVTRLTTQEVGIDISRQPLPPVLGAKEKETIKALGRTTNHTESEAYFEVATLIGERFLQSLQQELDLRAKNYSHFDPTLYLQRLSRSDEMRGHTIFLAIIDRLIVDYRKPDQMNIQIPNRSECEVQVPVAVGRLAQFFNGIKALLNN